MEVGYELFLTFAERRSTARLGLGFLGKVSQKHPLPTLSI